MFIVSMPSYTRYTTYMKHIVCWQVNFGKRLVDLSSVSILLWDEGRYSAIVFYARMRFWDSYLSRALQPFVGPFQFIDLFTQSVGLLGRGISPSEGRYLHTEQHKHRINPHTHPCLKRDLNPRSQCSSWRRQFMA
jgi:hypothetical protein